ncbi:MAG: ATP-binding protein [Bacillota bacterium]
MFQVEDSGPGVPEEHREDIWERYHQVRGPGTPGSRGSGPGIAIAREIVRAAWWHSLQ